MSDKLDQNGSEKKPFSGMLYQLKVSLFANKLTNWFFLRLHCHIGASWYSIASLS